MATVEELEQAIRDADWCVSNTDSFDLLYCFRGQLKSEQMAKSFLIIKEILERNNGNS